MPAMSRAGASCTLNNQADTKLTPLNSHCGHVKQMKHGHVAECKREDHSTRVVSDISPDTWVHVFDTDHERVVPRQCGCEERAADTFAGVKPTLNHADPLENYSARSQQSSLAAMLECLMLVDGGVKKISFGHDFAIELDPRGMAFNRHWATGHCHCGNA